jgi:hypothetical protein
MYSVHKKKQGSSNFPKSSNAYKKEGHIYKAQDSLNLDMSLIFILNNYLNEENALQIWKFKGSLFFFMHTVYF